MNTKPLPAGTQSNLTVNWRIARAASPLVIVLMLALFSTGCTTVLKTPKTAYAGYTPCEKIQLKVGLQVTDDLRKPEWKKGGTVIRPGDYLADNSELLARHVFADVVRADGSNAVPVIAGVDALLTPKLVYVNRTQGATSFGESITSVKVEWKLSDPGGKAIWLETITGEGRGSTGWTNPEKTLKQALEELLLKSQQAMSGADVIRGFSSRAKTIETTTALINPERPQARLHD